MQKLKAEDKRTGVTVPLSMKEKKIIERASNVLGLQRAVFIRDYILEDAKIIVSESEE